MIRHKTQFSTKSTDFVKKTADSLKIKQYILPQKRKSLQNKAHYRYLYTLLTRYFCERRKTFFFPQSSQNIFAKEKKKARHKINKNSREDSVNDAEARGEGGVAGKLLQHGARLTHGPEVRQLELADLAGALVLYLEDGVAHLEPAAPVAGTTVHLQYMARKANGRRATGWRQGTHADENNETPRRREMRSNGMT